MGCCTSQPTEPASAHRPRPQSYAKAGGATSRRTIFSLHPLVSPSATPEPSVAEVAVLPDAASTDRIVASPTLTHGGRTAGATSARSTFADASDEAARSLSSLGDDEVTEDWRSITPPPMWEFPGLAATAAVVDADTWGFATVEELAEFAEASV